jgi:mono/diheme cytochrome c family protein
MRWRILLAVTAWCWGCQATGPFREARKLGGRTIPAEVLNEGRVTYLQYCRACHGDTGEGNGPAATGLRPPPRNFTQGQFKFAGVLDQKLPRDEDLKRIIQANLHGTAMLGWEIPAPQLDALVQYLKTFSDAWKEDDAVGEPVVAAPDPWAAGHEAQAIARGALLYHGFAQCLACHPAYLERDEIDAASMALTGQHTTDFRESLRSSLLKPTDYRSAEGHPVLALPPDFLFNELRSVQPGTELTDLYRLLVSGVTGAAMPAWDPEVLPEKTSDVWALAYYVRSLARLRGTQGALAMKARLH